MSAYKKFIRSVDVGNITIEQINNTRLSEVDRMLAAYTLSLSKNNSEVYLATEDRALQEQCKWLGLKVLNLNELTRIMTQYVRTDISDVKDDINKKQKRILITRSIWAVIIILLLIGLYIFRDFIINNYHTIVPICLPIFGLLLYWFRSIQRSLYGLVEIGLGALGSIMIFSINDQNSNLSILTFFTIIGSIYMIVRGLDNIYQGSKGTKLEPILRKCLMERR